MIFWLGPGQHITFATKIHYTILKMQTAITATENSSALIVEGLFSLSVKHYKIAYTIAISRI